MFQNDVTRRGFVKAAVAAGSLSMLGLVACNGTSSNKDADSKTTTDEKAARKVSMVTDTGGVNDQSFNQGAWEGMEELQKKNGWEVSYIESKQESDYASNLDKAVDSDCDLVWGVGFAMARAVGAAAAQNPDVQFAIIDNENPTGAANITGVQFRAQEPSFIVGYIAARVSTTAQVGFVGGVSSEVIDQFEYGYRAGVAYANAEQNTNVQVQVQYAESFSDSAKGKSIAAKMFSDGCDIVFHAAGGVGTGIIEAAKEADKFAIGVDRDQAYLAPDHVLTSAMKNVNVAVVDVSQKLLNGELTPGSNVEFGFSEDGVCIPEDHRHYPEEVYQAAVALETKIKAGSITPPKNQETLDSFKPAL